MGIDPTLRAGASHAPAGPPVRLTGDSATGRLTAMRALWTQLVDGIDKPGQRPDVERLRELLFQLDEELADLQAG